jgi:endonuclease-3
MSTRRRLTPAERIQFFERLKAANPKPETELEYTSPFELLVAVILSAQATDVSVNRVTRRLFPLAHTPEAIVALGEPRLREIVQTIGLYRTKAHNLAAMAQILIEQHGSKVPSERHHLEALPGVGRKTANVILNTIFGEPTVAVDTHIFRVANRTGLAPGKDPEAVEIELLKVIPKPYLQDAHHWLILLGRYTCRARQPLCGACVVRELCRFPGKTAAAAS